MEEGYIGIRPGRFCIRPYVLKHQQLLLALETPHISRIEQNISLSLQLCPAKLPYHATKYVSKQEEHTEGLRL